MAFIFVEEELSEAGESADNSDSELGNPEDDVSDLESSEGEEEVEESCDLDKNTNMDKEKSANTSNTGDAEDIREMLKVSVQKCKRNFIITNT